MAFKLCLVYRGEQLVTRTSNTDDGDQAMKDCRYFAKEVAPVMSTLPQFKRVKENDLELRVCRV